LNFSGTKLFHQGHPAQIANNRPEYIGVRIALVQTFGVVLAAFPPMQPSRSIAFKCGMNIFSSDRIFSHMI
jgi:hypothetical protein